MPTYDYECDACGHAWEMFQRIVEDPIKKCPKCKKKKARRLFGTGSAVMFKGSGFYETDYRSDSYKKGEKAAKDAKAPKTESKGDKSTGQSGGSDSSSSSSTSKPKD